MGDYWQYEQRGRQPVPREQPQKRMRAEYDELPPARAQYMPARGDGYVPRERPYEGQLYEERPPPVYERARYARAPANDMGREDLGPMYAAGPAELQQLMPMGRALEELPPLQARGMMDVGMDAPPRGRGMGLNGGALPPEPEVAAPLDVLPLDASPTLFVDGLPTDCTRREAAHIFRPCYGYKEVRLVQKEAQRAPGEKVVLCFVEFADARCAAAAMEALQGYKFDESEPRSGSLSISFARQPGPRARGPPGPPPRGGGGREREEPYRPRERPMGGGRDGGYGRDGPPPRARW